MLLLSLLFALAWAEDVPVAPEPPAAEPAPPAPGPPAPEPPQDLAERPFVPAPPHDPLSAEFGVIFFGDSGSGNRAQTIVARRIQEFCAVERCDAGVLLGDNFYPHGVASADDPLWTTRFLEPYGALGFPFYPSLGNHDYAGTPEAQVGWTVPTGTPSTWNMPARRYTWTLGPITFLALDTNDVDGPALGWLRRNIAIADTDWVIAYGHHPLWSGGPHGDTAELAPWQTVLLRADVFLSGHDHHQQVISRPGLVQVIMGSGGAGLRPVLPVEGAQFTRAGFGFGYLYLVGDTMHVVIVDEDGAVREHLSWRKADIAAGVGVRPGQGP